MQTRCTVSLVLVLLTINVMNTHAQVNYKLSNLRPTSINESLVPDTNNTVDLGRSSAAWRDMYAARDVWVGRHLRIGNSLTIQSPGTNNVFLGNSFGSNITTGKGNIATGFSALSSTTTGESNVATGSGALQENTSGSYNIAMGPLSLMSNTTGNENVAIGRGTIFQNSTGYNNIAIGNSTMFLNIHGFNNVGVGANALFNISSGSNNTIIGAKADMSGDFNNATAIGANAIVNASNKVRVGNTAVTSIGGHVSWTSFSDARYKKNIKEDVAGLAFINRLRPVSYTIDTRGLDDFYNKARPQPEQAMDEKEKALHDQAIEEAGSILYDGFVAQEVEKAAKETGFVFSGVDKPANEQDLYGLRYDQFVVPLVKAVQELSARNDSLQHQLIELKEMLLAGNNSAVVPGFGITQQADVLTGQPAQHIGASLEQNRPNPFSKATAIPYTLPQKYSAAAIIITDYTGQKLRQIPISGAGKGILQIHATTLPANAYSYSLIVDGKLIGTRKMLLSR